MAWPPPVLPINRSNSTPQMDLHAQDHNAANLAINDIVPKVADLIRLPPQFRRNTPYATSGAGFASNAKLATLTIPADTQTRIAIASLHLQITVAALGSGNWNVGLYAGGTLLQLWSITSTGEKYLDGTVHVAIGADVATELAVYVGTLPAGTSAQSWGNDYANYLAATSIRSQFIP